MGFRMRSPSIKIGGVRFRKTKNGITMSSETIFGNRKTKTTLVTRADFGQIKYRASIAIRIA